MAAVYGWSADLRTKLSFSIIDEARRWLDFAFANVMYSKEHIQSDNELDSDFEQDEDEEEDEEVDEKEKEQISACYLCFCCTISIVESLF